MYSSNDIAAFQEQLIIRQLVETRENNAAQIEEIMDDAKITKTKLENAVNILYEVMKETDMPLVQFFDSVGDALYRKGCKNKTLLACEKISRYYLTDSSKEDILEES
jgi:hypothetical protein